MAIGAVLSCFNGQLYLVSYCFSDTFTLVLRSIPLSPDGVPLTLNTPDEILKTKNINPVPNSAVIVILGSGI
ncbi:hypothetical protein GCM10009122_48970 [Fulvivirga kasyanovii]